MCLLLALAIAGCGGGGGKGEPDTGVDGAPPPPPPDTALPDCLSDRDCNDRDFCNGTETCVEGECVDGEVPDCDDGDDCTMDSCSTSRMECVHELPDLDGDGFVASSCGGDDCDDSDANRYPGNLEVCDTANHDEDCDPSTVGGRDTDGDGEVDARCCNTDASGTDICGTDCDDVRRAVYPGAAEVCDGLDNDCDDTIDEGVAVMGWRDEDRDLFGDPAKPVMACPQETGFVTNDDDCDDANPARNGLQPEICDSIDNDCDGKTDEETRAVNWYEDLDGDGFGNARAPAVNSCAPVAGHVLLGSDCNDMVASINPSAAEMCDAIDNDCNGLLDFAISPGNFEDDDGDGIVDSACSAAGDCDDLNPAVGGASSAELCDGVDNDCDGTVDESTRQVVWFRDADGDGFGSSASGAEVSCNPVPGYSLRGGDCNDADPTRAPGKPEICDGFDQDCDGTVDEGLSC